MITCVNVNLCCDRNPHVYKSYVSGRKIDGVDSVEQVVRKVDILKILCDPKRVTIELKFK